LADGDYSGGCGCSYEEIALMTPDQVYHRLCDGRVLKVKGGHRTADAQPLAVKPDAQGLVRGRAEDGTPIVAKMNVRGKSLTRRLMEEEEAREREAAKKR
jgi:hypothetical protein